LSATLSSTSALVQRFEKGDKEMAVFCKDCDYYISHGVDGICFLYWDKLSVWEDKDRICRVSRHDGCEDWKPKENK